MVLLVIEDEPTWESPERYEHLQWFDDELPKSFSEYCSS